MDGKRFTLTLFPCLACCLVALLAACGQQPIVTAANQGTAANTATQPTQGTTATQAGVQTVAMPTTQTSCPADGSARAAIIKPLALGKNQNLVYIYNEIPVNTSIAFGHLKRYDLVTHQKTNIVTTGISIQAAQVSADGQWILLLSTPDPRGDARHSAMLQLVRMDGQGLQTLYCFPVTKGQQGMNAPTAQWSVDQKSLLLSYDTDLSTSNVSLLNVATGKLQTEIKYTDTNQLYHYGVAFWLDNTRAYVVKSGRFGPQPPIALDLLNIATNKDTNGSDLKQVLVHSIRMSNLSLDSSYDGSQLFVAYCLEAANPFDTTISVGPATGGAQKTLYHQGQTVCSKDMRVISANSLLIIAQTYPTGDLTHGRNQGWTMKTDGSGKKVLFDLPMNGTDFALNPTSQFPWSNVSRDGNFYAVQSTNNETKQSTVLVGALVGGTPSGIASTTRGNVSLAGWTTM